MPVFAYAAARRPSLIAMLRAKTGGGGIRTRVPERFKAGFYMFSYSFVSRLAERRITGFQLGQFVIFSLCSDERPCRAIPLIGALAESAGTIPQDELLKLSSHS